jgi:hypothetical protein
MVTVTVAEVFIFPKEAAIQTLLFPLEEQYDSQVQLQSLATFI